MNDKRKMIAADIWDKCQKADLSPKDIMYYTGWGKDKALAFVSDLPKVGTGTGKRTNYLVFTDKYCRFY